MTHLIKLSDSSQTIHSMCEGIQLKSYSYVGAFVNNGTEKCDGIGHWSLLVYHRESATFYHLDSISSLNKQHALHLANQLNLYLAPGEELKLLEVDCIQQRLNVECGVYALHFFQLICSRASINTSMCSEQCFKDPFSVDNMYKHIALLKQKHEPLKTNLVLNSHSLPSDNSQRKLGTSAHMKTRAAKTTVSSNTNIWSTVQAGKKKYKQRAERNLINNGFNIPTANRYDVLKTVDIRPNATHKVSNLSNINKPSRNKKIKPSEITNEIYKQRTNINTSFKTLPISKVKVTLYSDSQGSNVQDKIDKLSCGRINAFSYVRPNATLIQVTHPQLLEDENPLVLLGGTNDSLNNDYKFIYEKLEERLILLSKRRPVFISTVPARCDRPLNDKIHNDLVILNSYIEELVTRLQNVFLININSLKRFHFTQHGLHLNGRGKHKLAEAIIQSICEYYSTNNNSTPAPLLNQAIHPRSVSTANVISSETASGSLEVPSASKDKTPTIKSPLRVIDGDMDDIINSFRGDKNVAFAHCISADLDHERQMSAGVAVTFKKHFGKPQASDCLNKYLAYQNLHQGAGVYSLITKARYNFKPEKDDYDRAFRELTHDFQRRGYKRLICSPMGCVRDHIPIEHFIAKIYQFKLTTGASINIVTCRERSSAVKHGLTHQEFLKRMWMSIAELEEKTGTSQGTCNLKPTDAETEAQEIQPFQLEDQPKTPEQSSQAQSLNLTSVPNSQSLVPSFLGQ